MPLFFKKTSHAPKSQALGALRVLPLTAIAFTLAAAIFVGCEDEKKEVIAGSTNPETTPTMTTHDVVTLISDSGITRYHINTPLWLVFDQAEEPSWKFPEGLHIQTYDLKMKPEATIDCDTATFLKNKQIWHLKGYVDIRNTVGEKFLTEELFWDQKTRKVYSDSFIHIEKEQKVIEGYGFESNESMTRYHVKRVSGIFPAEQFKTDTTRRTATPAIAAEEPKPEPKPAPKRRVTISQRPIKVDQPINEQPEEIDLSDKAPKRQRPRRIEPL